MLAKVSLEKATNIATIAVCSLIVGVLAKTHLVQRPSAAANPQQEVVLRVKGMKGRKLRLNQSAWKTGQANVVLLQSVNCGFCRQSAGFYKEIAALHNKTSSFGLVALYSDSPEQVTQYVSSIGLPAESAFAQDWTSLDVLREVGRVTPVILITDRAGSIVDAWVGQLDGKQQSAFWHVLRRFCPSYEVAPG